MKIKIEYSFRTGCFLATTTVRGEHYTEASVESYEIAKQRLIEVVKKAIVVPKREPEEVEI